MQLIVKTESPGNWQKYLSRPLRRMVWKAMIIRWTIYKAQLSCFSLLVLVFGVHGSCFLNSEGLALLQFRAKVDFDPFGILANWNSNDCNPCMWSGIHCLDGEVYMLDLNGHKLEGVLAPELGSLSHLRVLDLSKNRLSGSIPHEFGQLTTLEVLDLTDNKLTGSVPAELGRLHSLKHLLLCNSGLEGNIPGEVEKVSLLADSQCDKILNTVGPEVGCVNRKFGHCIWRSLLKQSQKSNSFQVPTKGSTIIRNLNPFLLFKFGSASSDNPYDDSHENLTVEDLPESGAIWNFANHTNSVRRVLVEQSSNLAALSPGFTQFKPLLELPSRSSGSFSAIPNGKKLSPTPLSPPTLTQEPKNISISNSNGIPQPTGAKSGNSLKLIVGLSLAVFLLVVATAMCIICRSRAAKTIRPWKTGLSGQLQKAFVTGVPKLNRAELEMACEDFSNIITTNDGVATMYKGTLSSGVEIAVVSTAINSIKEWSKRAELVFRKKIDTLSRVNQKNFLNLIGYCEADEPFTRMMVFEYAPNGTLFEHLHVKEMEHLDWNARKRIIMGTAYCLEYMHELNPPISHPNLTSKEILLTDDYAAKIGDLSFWEEFTCKSSKAAENDSNHGQLPPLADVETNVLSFGFLLLEIISGKMPYSEEWGNLLNLATEFLNDKKMIDQLIDPTLKTYKDNELNVVCEVIIRCVQKDPRRRPSMREVVQTLRQAINVSPESATPRLSPLWWAELEILSAEAV